MVVCARLQLPGVPGPPGPPTKAARPARPTWAPGQQACTASRPAQAAWSPCSRADEAARSPAAAGTPQHGPVRSSAARASTASSSQMDAHCRQTLRGAMLRRTARDRRPAPVDRHPTSRLSQGTAHPASPHRRRQELQPNGVSPPGAQAMQPVATTRSPVLRLACRRALQ